MRRIPLTDDTSVTHFESATCLLADELDVRYVVSTASKQDLHTVLSDGLGPGGWVVGIEITIEIVLHRIPNGGQPQSGALVVAAAVESVTGISVGPPSMTQIHQAHLP